MRSVQYSFLLVAGVALSAGVASCQTLGTVETFKGGNPGTCTAPTPASTFTQSDASVNIYFLLNNLHPGDVPKVLWTNPAGTTPWYTVWDPVPNDGYSSRC